MNFAYFDKRDFALKKHPFLKIQFISHHQRLWLSLCHPSSYSTYMFILLPLVSLSVCLTLSLLTGPLCLTTALLAVPQTSSRKECGSATSRPQRPGSPKKGRSLSSPRADSGQWSRGGGLIKPTFIDIDVSEPRQPCGHDSLPV